MALFRSVFVISTLYLFLLSGLAPATAASAASRTVVALITFPLITSSASPALIGVGATAPRAMRAALQTPASTLMTDAILTMAKSMGFLNVNLRNVCRA